MPKRNIMRIDLSGRAKRAIEDIHGHHGMTQVAVMSRLVEWFASQDVVMQSAVIGRAVSEDNPDTTKMVLERMAKKE